MKAHGRVAICGALAAYSGDEAQGIVFFKLVIIRKFAAEKLSLFMFYSS